MKKAGLTLLVIFLLYACFSMGVAVGRRSASGQIVITATEHHQAYTSPSDTTIYEQKGKININTATLAQLQMLPGIGETLAQRIIAYREEYGSFSSIEDLTLVEGIGEKRINQLRQFITVGG